jgi:hypothetical protein
MRSTATGWAIRPAPFLDGSILLYTNDLDAQTERYVGNSLAGRDRLQPRKGIKKCKRQGLTRMALT